MLAVGQWIAWWSGLPRGSSSRGNFVRCFIIVVIFIGLGRAYRMEGRFWSYHTGGKPQRDGTNFMREVDHSRHHIRF